MDLRYTVTGDVPADRVERAIQLSRDKYCSVWHSMRPDIELTTAFEIVPRLTRSDSTQAVCRRRGAISRSAPGTTSPS